MQVFISHKWENEEKKNWVKALATDLIKKYKIECLLDIFEPIEYIAGYMQRIEKCDVILIVLTEKAIEDINQNTSNLFNEVSLALAQKAKSKIRIIPLLREGSELPTILSAYRFIDFRDENNYENKLLELNAAINLQSLRPEIIINNSVEVKFSEDIAAFIYNPKHRSKIDEYVSELGHLVHKIKAKDVSGKWAYYFILVSPDKENEFLKLFGSGAAVDLNVYGKIIASCYGEEPTKEIRSYLAERYGFDV